MKATAIYIELEVIELNQLRAIHWLLILEKESRLGVICGGAERVHRGAMVILLVDRNVEARRQGRIKTRLLNTLTHKEAF